MVLEEVDGEVEQGPGEEVGEDRGALVGPEQERDEQGEGDHAQGHVDDTGPVDEQVRAAGELRERDADDAPADIRHHGAEHEHGSVPPADGALEEQGGADVRDEISHGTPAFGPGRGAR